MSSLGAGLPFIAKVALLRGQAVILDTSVRGQVDLPGGANAIIFGYAVNDAAVGQEVAIHPVTDGSTKVKAIAGASVGIGDTLMGEGTDGRVKELAADNTVQYACGVALEDGEDGQLIDVMPCFFWGESALA